MVEIQLFGVTIDSTKLQLFITAIGVLVAIIAVYLNHRKKSAITTPITSQSTNNSYGVVQQNNMSIGQQTFHINENNYDKQLEIPYLEITEEVVSVLLKDNTDEGRIEAHRIKVKNKGKIAAENVCGIIEELNNKKLESRTSWHEGDKNVPYTTINAEDHMFLNIYGIIHRRSGKAVMSKTDDITMATEYGWKSHILIDTSLDLNYAIRVTAKNASSKRKLFKISRKNNLEMEFLNEY